MNEHTHPILISSGSWKPYGKKYRRTFFSILDFDSIPKEITAGPTIWYYILGKFENFMNHLKVLI